MLEQFFGIILTVSFSVAYIPQIIKMIRRKSSDDISLLMLMINAAGYYCGLGYVLTKEVNAYWLFINYSAGLIMTGLCIFIWVCYNKIGILFWNNIMGRIKNVKKF